MRDRLDNGEAKRVLNTFGLSTIFIYTSWKRSNGHVDSRIISSVGNTLTSGFE